MLTKFVGKVLALGLVMVIAGCAAQTARDADDPKAFSDGGIPTTISAVPAETQAAGNMVAIDNFAFSPARLTVDVGTTVTWVNHDDVPHTATSSDEPRVFNSGALDTDQKYSFTFKTAGTYAYFCEVHPHMTGVIVVR